MTQWAPVVALGLVNLVGLAFAAGAVIQRLKATEATVDKIPADCKETARVMDLEHLLECHPRTAARVTGEAKVIQ